MAFAFELQPVTFALPDLDQIARDTFFHVGDQKPEFPDWTAWVLPWTLVKDKPGVATFVIDLWSFAGLHAAKEFFLASKLAQTNTFAKLTATYMAIGIRLGMNPKWVAAFFGAADIATQKEWWSRIKNYVEGNTGGLVFQTTPVWLSDP